MAPSYYELKCSLSSVPAKVLNVSSRQILGKLDLHQPLRSSKGYARDSRGLAELMGFLCHEVKPFEGSSAKILEAWETRSGSTLDKLIGYLEDMDRYDVIQDLLPTLKKDVEKYKKSLVAVAEEKDVANNQKTPIQVDEEKDVEKYKKSLVAVAEGKDVANNQKTPIQVDEENNAASNQESPIQVDEVSSGLRKRILTVHDKNNRECTAYDAYLAYDDDDLEEASHIAQKLESPTVGLKIYFRVRDLLAGNFEFETDLEMIMNRCRRMLMILTPNFIRNPTLEFQVNFAAKLGVERNERILIPVVVKPCGIPPVLKDMAKVDLTKKYCKKWLWDNLIKSIQPDECATYSLPSLERGTLDEMDTTPNSICSVPEDMD